MYAFWNYNLFPYLLGDEVEEIKGRTVKPKNYGGMWFTAAFFLPEDQGKDLNKNLERLRGEKQLKKNELDFEFREKLDKVLANYSGAKVKY